MAFGVNKNKSKNPVPTSSDDINVYMEDNEYIANKYVMNCFGITILVYTAAFLLNLAGIFIIEQRLMIMGYIPSMIIFLIVYAVSKFVSLSNKKMKYFLLLSVILVFTIAGVTITYHVVLASLLPFLYATLYSSRPVMRYVYFLTVISTFIVVYGGYYFGLCDANMVLLTVTSMQDYVADGQFILTEVNSDPFITLLLFFVMPRCFIYIAFMSVCSSIYKIVSGSLEKARLTDELEKAKTEAENASKAKSRFLARMSHEIRTPINAVIGMNEMILRESEEENIRKYAAEVRDSSRMLLNIVNEVLDSSKIESGMMEIVPERYSSAELLNDIYSMMSVKAKEKKLELVFNISPSIPKELIGDDKRIRQILLNLLSNAVKYTNSGTVTLSVSGSSDGENAVLHFAVKDTGIGIKQEDIGKIFDEFSRFDASRNKNVEGTGLGMNIVWQLLRLMDSKLEIQSEYEKGSEFSFDLVQKIADSSPLGDFRRHEHESGESRLVYTAHGAKILAVDDNVINLKVFKALLKQTKINIYEAESGQECLDLMKREHFDIVFLDHMMPEMDGIETLRRIRSDGLDGGVPIIMLTANAIAGDKERYINEGFDDFLSKPIIPDELDRMILHYLPQELIDPEDGSSTVSESVPAISVIEALRSKLPEINVEKGLASCGGDEDFYLELFKDYTELPVMEELTGYLLSGDYKNYCIRIHGFKSNSYSLGAAEIGDLAYEMEKLTRDGLPDEIAELQNELSKKYDIICRGYKEAVKNQQTK
ncbi:MAG: response regulator [Oscillospiraceae bacterium]